MRNGRNVEKKTKGIRELSVSEGRRQVCTVQMHKTREEGRNGLRLRHAWEVIKSGGECERVEEVTETKARVEKRKVGEDFDPRRKTRE